MDEQQAWAYIGRALAEKVGATDLERREFERAAENLGISPSAISGFSKAACDECLGENEE